jgi:4-amino-4-deoxy-L-arabinose transferase-like glycosyltransferase
LHVTREGCEGLFAGRNLASEMSGGKSAATVIATEKTAESKHTRWLTIAGLGLIVLLGAYLRIFDLNGRSITHVEMYVPGIGMPQGISVPGERLTLPKVLTGTFSSDTHPPGYYVLMWAWTKFFGTSALAIRLPSAIFGTACILLIFWLGTLAGQRTAGWIAAILLAVNAHQIFWSQVARMFTLACFLGLLATALLLLLAKNGRGSRSFGFLYVLIILLGVSCHIFFWALFGTHIVWTFFNSWSQRQPFPGIGKLQILAFILGSPLLAFAAYQNGNELATLSGNALVYAREFLQFSFLFPLVGFSSGVYPREPHIFLTDDPHLSIARWSFFLLSLVLFLLGVASIQQSEEKRLVDTRGVSPRVWLLAAGLGTVTILFFVFMAKAFLKPRPNPTLRTTELMTVLPLLLASLAIVLQRGWKRLADWRGPDFKSRLLTSVQALPLALAVVPFALLAGLSLFKPTFNARGMLLLGPYILLVLAWGIVRASRYRIAAIPLLVVLCIAHYDGWMEYRHMATGRADYKAFATALAPHIDKTDLIFLNTAWYSTPIFYYLNSDWDQFVGRNYEMACRQNPHARVWALLFYNYEETIPIEMEAALSKYRVLRTVEAPGVRAILYSPENF